MGLKLKDYGGVADYQVGPTTQLGTSHAGGWGLRFVTSVPNVIVKSAKVYGSAGTVVGQLYRVTGGWTLISTFNIVVPTSNVLTEILINLNCATAGDYWLGISGTANLFRGPETFPKVQSGIVSVNNGCQFYSDSYAANWYFFFNLTFRYGSVDYSDTGSAVYGPYDISAAETYFNSQLAWAATLPGGTSAVIKTGINNGVAPPSVWDTAATIGTDVSPVEIPGIADEEDLTGKYLWIKVEAATTVQTSTPNITSLGAIVIGPDYTNVVTLALPNTGRLKFPQGDVTVTYTRLLGGMEGAVSVLVEDWIESFTPTGIVPVINPYVAEQITVSATADVDLIAVTYSGAQLSGENISLDISATVLRIHIDDLEN